jgi:hypothetical protein
MAHLSSRRPEFDVRSVHVRFVVENMELGQVFLRVLRFTLVTIIPPALRTHLHVHVAFTGRLNRRILGIFQKAVFSRKSWGVRKYFDFLSHLIYQISVQNAALPTL